MVEVVEAEARGGYSLHLRFSDGVEGVADLSSCLWGPVFEALRDPANFCRFRVSNESGTIEWENGADMAPEALEDLVLSQGRGLAPTSSEEARS